VKHAVNVGLGFLVGLKFLSEVGYLGRQRQRLGHFPIDFPDFAPGAIDSAFQLPNPIIQSSHPSSCLFSHVVRDVCRGPGWIAMRRGASTISSSTSSSLPGQDLFFHLPSFPL
jgi:hypothetical protein